MPTTTEPTLATLMDQLEEIWRHVDTLLDPLTPANWQRKHGKDWVFADLPYHLSYYDRETVADPIRIGSDLPVDKQKLMRTMGELDAWNARKFAERRPGQSVGESLAQMRASRDAVRQAVAGLTDAELERHVFIHLVGCGWVNVSLALQSCLVHTWSHFTEARLRLKQAAPIPSPAITHTALSFFLGMMPMMISRDKMPPRPFTAVTSIGGPGAAIGRYASPTARAVWPSRVPLTPSAHLRDQSHDSRMTRRVQGWWTGTIHEPSIQADAAWRRARSLRFWKVRALDRCSGLSQRCR